MKISIIIPAYNEEKTIKEIISRVRKVKLGRGIIKEIIVIDDASKDRTSKILKNIRGIKVITHKKNLGKGAAVRTGIDKAKGKIIIIQDADLEYDPQDYPKLISPIIAGKGKVVYGSRLSNFPLHLFGSKKTPLLLHYFGNKFLSLVTRLLYSTSITDMETGYKLFHRSALEGIDLKSKRFELEPEITAKILRRNLKIYEVPIRVKPRGYQEGKKITWKDGFVAIWTLIKYRFHK